MIGEYWQIGYPGTDLAVVLLRHHSYGLRDVSEIVHDPRGEQLPERDGTERGVLARQVQVARSELPRPQQLEVVSSQPRKLVEQRRQRPIDVSGAVPESIVRLEPRAWSAREDDARARDPVRLLTVDQMSDDIEGAERLRAFVAANPRLGQAAKQGLQRRRRTREHIDRQIEIEVHDVPSWGSRSDAKLDDLVRDARAGDLDPRHGNRQREAAWTGTPRVQVQHIVADLHMWAMGVAGNDGSEAGRPGIQVEIGQVVQNIYL